MFLLVPMKPPSFAQTFWASALVRNSTSFFASFKRSEYFGTVSQFVLPTAPSTPGRRKKSTAVGSSFRLLCTKDGVQLPMKYNGVLPFHI